ncbi:MAG: coiled-coil domain-containing protein [Planctomycetota bacterium]|jgi:hypothetical protein
MAIKVTCGCGAKFNVREELAGKSIECTACGKKVAVPHPVAAGGGGKGPVIFGLLLLGAAIAGCGYMIWTQQETIKDLQASLDAQQGDLAKLDGTLRSAAQRVDGIKDALDANAAADAATSADRKLDKQAIDAVRQDLAAESTRRKELVGELDRLDTDALRIRGDIEQASKERDEAWDKLSKANRDKQKEYEVQIAKLQDDMATKADDQAAQDRLAAEVKRLEDARDALVKQANADRSKLTTYDSRISNLNRQLQAKLSKQNQLQFDLDQAELKLRNLSITVSRPKLPKQLSTLQQKVNKVDQNTAPAFQTLTFDDRRRGESFWFRVNTRTGRVTYKSPRYSGIIQNGPQFAGWGKKQAAGRYAIQYTVRRTGNINDLVLIDSDQGMVWSCEVGMGSVRTLNWNRLILWKPASPGGLKQQGKWRLSVSRDGGSMTPLLVLTDPNGRVYDDSMAHRRWMVPVSP